MENSAPCHVAALDGSRVWEAMDTCIYVASIKKFRLLQFFLTT